MIMSVEELQSKWIDVCIERSSTPQEMNAFTIMKALPLILQEDMHVVLVNKTLEAINQQSVEDIYVTEQELQRIWVETSSLPFGKPIHLYNTKDALLLLVEDDLSAMDDDAVENVSMSTTQSDDKEVDIIYVTDTVSTVMYYNPVITMLS
jgi:hypothetical protein